MQTLLITGTDTDVGKTVLTTALAAYWQKYHSPDALGLMKLMQTGLGDQELYQQLFPSLEVITPLRFAAPLAPPLAAAQEGKTISLKLVWQALTNLQKQKEFVLVEALGGLGSPVTEELTVADLAGAWRLNTVLVVPVKLGAIGQAVANVSLARQTKVKLAGIILSCITPEAETKLEEWAAINLIQSLTQVPVLGILPYLTNPQDLSQLVEVASALDVEYLLKTKIMATSV